MTFMKDLLSRGYAKEPKTVAKEGKCWYLPHHGEKQAHKLGKIRVFFNLRADFNGALINKALLSGLDLTSNITGVFTTKCDFIVLSQVN